MFQCSLTGGGVWCVQSSQECYIYYTSACSNAPSLGVVYGVFTAHKNVIYIILQHVPMLPHWGRCTVYGVFIVHKNVIYIILQHVPMLPHWGRCTVCLQLTRMLYILYFSMFRCSLTGGGVRCVHSSQECYIYFTSACSDAHSLGAVYGVFIAHKNVIYILLQHVPMLTHWGWCTVCS